MTATREEIIEKGLIAALELAAERSWHALTLSDVAAAAGLELADFHTIANKQTLADAASAHFDKAMSAEGFDDAESPRERLFDVIMLRFEAMEPYREGLKSLLKWQDNSPAQRVKRLAARKASADWALVSAGLDGNGIVPADLRAVGVGYALARAELAWRKETDAGFARTMAELDKQLRELDERAAMVSRFTNWHRPGKTETETGSNEADADAPEAPPEATSPA